MTRSFCDDVGLYLLGFKSAHLLQPHHRIFHSYFVYPNERGVTGSAAFLSTLICHMTDKKLMAIARYFPRRNAEPVLVALLPQLEKENEKDQVRPPGFHMIRLPWGEEIRDLTFPIPDSLHLPPGLTDAARNVVKAMKLDG